MSWMECILQHNTFTLNIKYQYHKHSEEVKLSDSVHLAKLSE